MTALKTGALFAGYLGLEMGVSQVLDTELAWYSEIDKGALKILGHHVPGVPNLGDITAVDWTQVEPVDVLTGGSPCQDLSHAGKRAGMTEGTRSNLWVAMREAIAILRPSLVVWENVRGAYSAAADSAVEPCPGCLGDGPGPVLRALGRVLGDLSDLGYDAQWHGLRAADVGAPHGRFRVFVAAYPGGGQQPRPALTGDGLPVAAERGLRPAVASDDHFPWHYTSAGVICACGQPMRDEVCPTLLPTPQARDWKGAGPADLNRHDPNLSAIAGLLPTPRATDGTKGGPNQRGSSGDLMLPSAVHLLPTPMVGDAASACNSTATRHKIPPTGIHAGDTLTDTIRKPQDWGQYAGAIARWESLTRPAPAPTELGPKGSPRLSARFSEWMMGLPDGWITNVPGITRNEALKAAGNGVVPQQADAALRLMLARASEVAA